MDKSILEVIKYFDKFAYPPKVEEIHNFISYKISLGLLNERLRTLCREKKLSHSQSASKFSRFVLFHRQHLFVQQKTKEKISIEKLKKIKLYLKILNFFPQIKLVGLSGSMAMKSASLEDDIDLFIITGKNRLFTGRFIATVLGDILRIRRQRSDDLSSKYRDKVCLNLFFDEAKMMVPKTKQTVYVGHEILQMRPIINKKNTYKKFLAANNWVFKFFPNFKV